MSYPATERTIPTRSKERARYDHATVHAICDAHYLCHLGYLGPDGTPIVIPTLYARDGHTLYLHGSTGARAARGATAPLPVCVTITEVNDLVLTRSAFHHSINYRSVVIRGTAERVRADDERRHALNLIVDAVVAGRADDCRPPNARELAQTAVLRVPIIDASAKIRTGGANDEPEDLTSPHWAGLVPVHTTYGTPIPADDLAQPVPTPAYLPH